jgi:conjugal transfer pilus assembly protein TrbC
MPNAALKAYFEDAETVGARLVVRGLYKDSFEETRQKVQELEIAYDIDPDLFEKYEISSVPTIVKDEGRDIKKVSGHITLKSALEIFSKE